MLPTLQKWISTYPSVGIIMFSISENVLDINSIPVQETTIMSNRTSQIIGEPFMLHMHIAMP